VAKFPSKEWCEQAVGLLNQDPEVPLASRGWKGDLAMIIDPEPGKLDRPFVVHSHPKEGQPISFKILPDPDDLDEIEPVYLIRAPYSIWRGMIEGTIDPMEAVLRRRIAVKGDLQPLIERLKFKAIADRVLASLKTDFR
jgi:putative sterol carrier protein